MRRDGGEQAWACVTIRRQAGHAGAASPAPPALRLQRVREAGGAHLGLAASRDSVELHEQVLHLCGVRGARSGGRGGV